MPKKLYREDFNLDKYGKNRRSCFGDSFFPAYMMMIEMGEGGANSFNKEAFVELERVLRSSGQRDFGRAEHQFEKFHAAFEKRQADDAFWEKWGYPRGAYRKALQASVNFQEKWILGKFLNPGGGYLKIYLSPDENPLVTIPKKLAVGAWHDFWSRTPLINTFEEELEKSLDAFGMQNFANEIQKAANRALLLSVNQNPELVDGLPDIFRNQNRKPDEPVFSKEFTDAVMSGELSDAVEFLPGYKTAEMGDMIESLRKNASELREGKGDYQPDHSLLKTARMTGQLTRSLVREAGSASGTERMLANLNNDLARALELRLENVEDLRESHKFTADRIRNLGRINGLEAFLPAAGTFSGLASIFETTYEIPAGYNRTPVGNALQVQRMSGPTKDSLLELSGEDFEQYSKEFEGVIGQFKNPELTLKELKAGVTPAVSPFYKAKVAFSYDKFTNFRQQVANLSKTVALSGGTPVPVNFKDVNMQMIEEWGEAGKLNGYSDFKSHLNEISEITQVGKPSYGLPDTEFNEVKNHYENNLAAVNEYIEILRSEFNLDDLEPSFKDVFKYVSDNNKIDPALTAKIQQIAGNPVPAHVDDFIKALMGVELYAKYGDESVRKADAEGELKYQIYLNSNLTLRGQLEMMVRSGSFMNLNEINSVAWEIIKSIDPKREESARVGGPLGEIYGKQTADEIVKLQQSGDKMDELRSKLGYVSSFGYDPSIKIEPKDGPTARQEKMNKSCVNILKDYEGLKQDIEDMGLLSESEIKMTTKDCKKKDMNVEDALLAQKIRKFVVLPYEEREKYLKKYETSMPSFAAENFKINPEVVLEKHREQHGSRNQQPNTSSNSQEPQPSYQRETVNSEPQNNEGKPKMETKEEWEARQAKETKDAQTKTVETQAEANAQTDEVNPEAETKVPLNGPNKDQEQAMT